MHHFREIVKKHWGAIVIVSLFGAVSALWLSLQQTPQYVSNTRILIAYKKFEGVDGYSALRATEKMGQNLANIMGTASFLDKVLQAGFSVRDTFPQDEFTRREMWEGMLQVEVVPDTSILDISVLHPDRAQAERIVAATSKVLIANGKDYLGIENLNIQVVDAPLTSVAPVKPQIPVNTAMGFLIGFILSTGVTLLRELFAMNKKDILAPRPVTAQQNLNAQAAALPIVQTTVTPVKPASLSEARDAVGQPPPLIAQKVMPQATQEKSLPKSVMPFEEFLQPVKQAPSASAVLVTTPLPAIRHEHTVKTMHDHVKAPFGGQYFFQHKLIQLDN